MLMYLAELRGKLSPRVERMEDVLTSNVFSFFKYSSRDIFLKGYLNGLGFEVSTKEAEEAEFRFWPPIIIIKKDKFVVIPQEFRPHFKWTNWQLVSSFLDNILGSTPNIKKPERDFCLDLYNLLDKKHLRSFQNITYNGPLLKDYISIFFNAKTAKLRGDFIGFIDSLSLAKGLKPVGKTVFFSSTKRIFKSLSKLEKLKQVKSPIFFKEDESNE